MFASVIVTAALAMLVPRRMAIGMNRYLPMTVRARLNIAVNIAMATITRQRVT